MSACSWQKQAITRPPSLPTLRTLPQSRPSMRTVAHPSSLRPSGPPNAFMRVLGWSETARAPPSTCSGSSSGLARPVHTVLTRMASVPMATLRQPCMFALSSRRGPAALKPPPLAPPPFVASASRVKRSLIARTWLSGGSMMCTSGSRHRGSWIPSTTCGDSTRIGTSCVMMVSRSRDGPSKSMAVSLSSLS